MPTLPSTRRYTDLPVISPQTWDSVTAVRTALQELERGQFVNVSMMVEALIADDRIAGVISQRIDGLLGLPLSMTPPEGLEDDEKALEIASEAMESWSGIADESTIRQLWIWGRFLGVGVAEKIWTTTEDGWTPKVKVWHPRFIYWRWDTRTFWLTTQEGPVELKEGDPHWVIYTPFGYQRGWIHALVRSLAIPWLFRQFAYRDWGRFNEVHGMPIRGLIEPSEWDDKEKQKALDEIAGLASESVVRLPQIEGKGGFDLKLIEAQSKSYDAFKLAIEQANSSIAIVLLGQNLTAEVKGGSLAASQVHERVAASIIRSDAETLSTTLRRDVLVEWAIVNFGDPEWAPWPKWATEPPDDVKTKAEGMKAIGDGIKSLKAAGVPVDRAELAERFDVPLEEGVAFEDPAPPPAPFGAPGATPPGQEPDDQVDEEPPEDDTAEEDDQEPEKLSVVQLSRKRKAAAQGQVYADQLADHGRQLAARILAGDVRALKQVVAQLEPDAAGGIDLHALRQKLVAVYRGMSPDELARLTEKCLMLAELSGRYAVQKELLAGAGRKGALSEQLEGITKLAQAIADKPHPPAPVIHVHAPAPPKDSDVIFKTSPDGTVVGATFTTKE